MLFRTLAIIALLLLPGCEIFGKRPPRKPQAEQPPIIAASNAAARIDVRADFIARQAGSIQVDLCPPPVAPAVATIVEQTKAVKADAAEVQAELADANARAKRADTEAVGDRIRFDAELAEAKAAHQADLRTIQHRTGVWIWRVLYAVIAINVLNILLPLAFPSWGMGVAKWITRLGFFVVTSPIRDRVAGADR